jgi:hypothetical protein
MWELWERLPGGGTNYNMTKVAEQSNKTARTCAHTAHRVVGGSGALDQFEGSPAEPE